MEMLHRDFISVQLLAKDVKVSFDEVPTRAINSHVHLVVNVRLIQRQEMDVDPVGSNDALRTK